MAVKNGLNQVRALHDVGEVIRQPGGDARKIDIDRHVRLLTVNQAAERCQLSVRQLRRMIKKGELPVVRFGKAVRIHPRHLGLQ
jgi:excisionase family DNA binding protein